MSRLRLYDTFLRCVGGLLGFAFMCCSQRKGHADTHCYICGTAAADWGVTTSPRLSSSQSKPTRIYRDFGVFDMESSRPRNLIPVSDDEKLTLSVGDSTRFFEPERMHMFTAEQPFKEVEEEKRKLQEHLESTESNGVLPNDHEFDTKKTDNNHVKDERASILDDDEKNGVTVHAQGEKDRYTSTESVNRSRSSQENSVEAELSGKEQATDHSLENQIRQEKTVGEAQMPANNEKPDASEQEVSETNKDAGGNQELNAEENPGAEEQEDEEGFDHQYNLPQQLRSVIPGTNIDYYDYVLLEERLARGETDEPPDERGGLLPDGPEKEMPVVNQTNGVFSYCYTSREEDILSRCSEAAKHGEGVYIPLVNMTDFGAYDDYERGNPATQEVSLPLSHYKDSRTRFPSKWFESITNLKKQTHLAVGGLWFGPPDFEEMSIILRENPNVFDGILVDWDNGEKACMNELKTPPRFDRRGIQNSWWNPKSFFMRYYVGRQDKKTCVLKDGRAYVDELFISHRHRAGMAAVQASLMFSEIDVPFGWNMTFPCFGGFEGRCYRAFTAQPKVACTEAQRYVFAPYDRYSESMMILLNDTCANLGRQMPPHDLVLAI